MGILSTIEAAVAVGPYQVEHIGSVYFVGPWGVSADGNFLGPFPIVDAEDRAGPYGWWNDGTNQWLGPWVVA